MSAPFRKESRSLPRAARLLSSSFVLGLSLLTSCVAVPPRAFSRGLLYTHVVRPLDVNAHDTRTTDTPRAIPLSRVDPTGDNIKHISYSLVNVVWGEASVHEMARAAGFEEVLYADLETLTVLAFWTQRWVHVYGR